MNLSTRVAPYVSAEVRARGADYYGRGKVRISQASNARLTATVRGTERYGVDLELVDGAVLADCTCPYRADFGRPCKHIWATLLSADRGPFARSHPGPLRLTLYEDDGSGFTAESAEGDDGPGWRPAAKPAPAPPRETWKDLLAKLADGAEPAAAAAPVAAAVARQIVYVVDGPASARNGGVEFDIMLRERKVNGDWSAPKANATAATASHFAGAADRRVRALLGGATNVNTYAFSSAQSYGSGASSRYRAAGAFLEEFVPALAETGRVFYRADPAAELEPLAADAGPAWDLTLDVEKDAAGKNWVLVGRLRRGDEFVPVAGPTLLVPGAMVWAGRLARVSADAFPIAGTLRKVGSIIVPVKKGAELVGDLLAIPRLPRLTLPDELGVREIAEPPRPRLTLKPPKDPYGPPFLLAELSFDYGGTVVPARPFARGVYSEAAKTLHLRDAAAERAAEEALLLNGVRANLSAYEPRLELKPALLPALTRTLIAAGWHVEADGKLYRRPDAIDITVKSGRDWFDLAGGANFGGQTVPFPKLLEALLRGDATVPLGDGTLGMLPEDWLKKYGLIAQMGRAEGDAVRFTAAQAGVLDALLAARPEVTVDAQFKKARDRLKKFAGVTPAEPPAGFTGDLRAYQKAGLGWLRFLRTFGVGGCLADDMGLGKTVQVLALLAGDRRGPALVVVPRSLVFNWKAEAAKFAPHLRVLDHTGAGRDKTLAKVKDYDIILATYGTLRLDAASIANIRFDTCVLDESQAAKNAATDTAKAVKVVRADHRLALSGTPVENHLGELWTLFDFLNPGLLGRALPAAALRNPDAETREFLARALKPYILRRTKAEVAKDLPAKTEQTVFCDLEPAQRKQYDELRDHYRAVLLKQVDAVGLAKSKIQVLEALLRLRQAACHPGLIDRAKKAEPSAKLDVLLPQLRELAEAGTKVLVFSQFTTLLGIVKDRLDAEGLTYEYLDGKTRDRQGRVERFQTDPACRLFLVSLKAGGVGLNLTAAEYVFLLDPWWNPAVEAQAIDRTHRIGQTKPVFAYRLIARNTVEEKVLALQADKRALADAILAGDGRPLADLKREDLEVLLS